MDKNFTTLLYNDTKYYHKQVDNHAFTDLIMKDKQAGNIYINFNKICILHLQKTLNLNNKILQKKLYREIDINRIDINLYNNDNLKKLLNLCEEYPFEHLYLFILGIIKGGNILKKYISEEHHNFLTFNNSKELSVEFKNYINDNVNDEKNFIEIVKNTYEIIKLCFDDFYLMRQ